MDIAVAKLKVLKTNHASQKYCLEDKVRKDFPEMISKTEQRIKGYESDIKHLNSLPIVEEGISPMSVNGETFTEKEKAGAALIAACQSIDKGQTVKIGNYKGFDMLLRYDPLNYTFCLDLKRELTYSLSLGESESGNITRIDNTLASIEEKLLVSGKEQLETLHQQLEDAKAELRKPFSQEQELADKSARLAQLNAELNMDDSKDEKTAEQSENSKEEEIKKPEIATGSVAAANTPTATTEEKPLDKNKNNSID